METKMFEVRDRGTKIPVIAITTRPEDAHEACFWEEEGFSAGQILLIRPERQQAFYDPYKWDDTRSMRTAHLFIKSHFHELPNNAVIDVRVILKEATASAQTEIWTEENINKGKLRIRV